MTGNYRDEKIFLSFSTVYCGAVFVTVKGVFDRIICSDYLAKGITVLGQCTFGVYLFHYLGLDCRWSYNLYEQLIGAGINRMVAILIVCCLIMVVCYILTYLLRKLPLIRKLI